ncbi:MAG: RtcB family protein [Thermoflexales bacterium]|nr:RtcB family protein [Thermoflexales bacterium]MCS7323954.1 RtcB family protein [Thermoflexales bacterium]MCX7939024.1 RtcB family protein [Thermoflexales bacterium]MDW8053197.1 RtcB family protein [Anaerolineae bacterium]MDW8291848.1 RtcB family protein [Anaerolineae bacterium]
MGKNKNASLRSQPLPYAVWGEAFIDNASRQQMDNAMRLPVSVAGALMPDAHVGYGLPIGGVLATEDAVIPYAVGVDIACRMRLSVFDAPPELLKQQEARFEKLLRENTRFGAGAEWHPPRKDPILDDPDWKATKLLRELYETKAVPQLGTSGSGNHFVEFGELEVLEYEPKLGLQPGRYLALLSHSGSRGVGYQIADYYSKLARSLHPELPKELAHLAWLDIESEPGQEYWLAMNLAGRFASANHRVIHNQIARAGGLEVIATVENHHNFAWRERLPDGHEVFVHRKGATPAHAGVLGVIPGTMGDPGYVVRGKGNPLSLNSASHGAGRRLSRNEAFRTLTAKMRNEYLKQRGVKLLGGGLDESPQAYKNIDEVIAAQADLVDVIARFQPRLVMMTDDPRDI